MLKPNLIYIIVFLMFLTSALYFLVAIFGEGIESSEARGVQLGEGQEDETAESGHNEEQKAAEIHNESSEATEQHLQEQEAVKHNADEIGRNEKGEQGHDETSENQRRNLEFPLSIGAGVGYAAVGLWMILNKGNNKIPYVIAIVGSLVLLGIYFASRSVGIFSIGTEPFGLFDVTVAGIQVAIIAISSHIIIRNTH